MEKYTVSKDLAQKLKDGGFEQNTQYSWYQPCDGASYEPLDKWRLVATKNILSKPDFAYNSIAAPLSDEVLEHLPSFIPSEQYEQKAYLWMRKDPTSYCAWYRVNDPKYGEDITSEDGHVGEKLADQLAQLWLYCKEHGYLEGQDVPNL